MILFHLSTHHCSQHDAYPFLIQEPKLKVVTRDQDLSQNFQMPSLLNSSMSPSVS